MENDWQDLLQLDQQLSDDERLTRDSVRRWCDEQLVPRVTASFRHARHDPAFLQEAGKLGMLGVTLSGYGCPGMSYVSYGLLARELERVDAAGLQEEVARAVLPRAEQAPALRGVEKRTPLDP